MVIINFPPPNSRLLTPARRGFALLFAMFVSSIMLSIGLGIANVIYKELVLSGIGRESGVSFYVAQTGLECAEYLNANHPEIFPRPGDTGSQPDAGDTCDGKSITDYRTTVSSTEGLTAFKISIKKDTEDDICARVTVKKGLDNYLTVESRGYNTCVDDNPRRVERSLKMVTYVILPGS